VITPKFKRIVDYSKLPTQESVRCRCARLQQHGDGIVEVAFVLLLSRHGLCILEVVFYLGVTATG
jgi:hypothetical protein